MFLYYLINVWKKKQSWLKETLSRYPALPDWSTYACSYGRFSSCLGGISEKSSEISPRRAGSLLIWTHYIFVRVSLRKVRSHLGELARLTEPLTIVNVNVDCKCSLTISDSLLSSETMLNHLLENFPFSGKCELIVRQKFLLSDTSLIAV